MMKRLAGLSTCALGSSYAGDRRDSTQSALHWDLILDLRNGAVESRPTAAS